MYSVVFNNFFFRINFYLIKKLYVSIKDKTKSLMKAYLTEI
jgi:hypothetical protein